jgi:hypothetical protein
MWMGGNVPLGYAIKERKLAVNQAEAATVRAIFKRYAELGSVALLNAELDRQGIVSKRLQGAGGRLAGGQRLSRGALYLMLQNRIYRGEIASPHPPAQRARLRWRCSPWRPRAREAFRRSPHRVEWCRRVSGNLPCHAPRIKRSPGLDDLSHAKTSKDHHFAGEEARLVGKTDRN